LLKSNTKQQECIHHWIIDSPHGHISYGRCRLCGAVNEFFNTLTHNFVGRDGSKSESVRKIDNIQAYHLD